LAGKQPVLGPGPNAKKNGFYALELYSEPWFRQPRGYRRWFPAPRPTVKFSRALVNPQYLAAPAFPTIDFLVELVYYHFKHGFYNYGFYAPM